MLLKVDTQIQITGSPQEVWDFASDPKIWTASNPEEHFGLKFDSSDNRPHTGVTFHQRESVAGLKADLHGHFLYVDAPNVAVWRGLAKYKLLFGLYRPILPEGGVILIKSHGNSLTLSHNVYIDFPDTLFGKIMAYGFKKWLNGEEAVYSHTYKELKFIKREIEKQSTSTESSKDESRILRHPSL